MCVGDGGKEGSLQGIDYLTRFYSAPASDQQLTIPIPKAGHECSVLAARILLAGRVLRVKEEVFFLSAIALEFI